MTYSVSSLRQMCYELLNEISLGRTVTDRLERLEQFRSSPRDSTEILSVFDEIGEDSLRIIQMEYSRFLIFREAEAVASTGYKYTANLSFYKSRIQFEIDMAQQLLGKKLETAVVFGCGAWPKTVLTLGEIGIRTLGVDIDSKIISQNSNHLANELISFECVDALNFKNRFDFDAAWIAGTIGLSSEQRKNLVAKIITDPIAKMACIRQPVREEQLFFPTTPIASNLISFNLSVNHPTDYMARSFVVRADHSPL